MRNRVSREDDNEILSFHPKKPGFLTDVLAAVLDYRLSADKLAK
ncbi:hypothetical protein [Coleofasciculus sp.]